MYNATHLLVSMRYVERIAGTFDDILEMEVKVLFSFYKASLHQEE